MLPCSTQSGVEGHRTGGPRCFTAAFRALLASLVLFNAACGSSPDGTEPPRPTRGEPFARPLEIYRDLGLMTGSGQFPVVASFSTMAGPADSTYVLLALSIPNSALRFQRAGDGFFAEYRLDVTFMDPDSTTVRRVEQTEVVRVSSFGETGRTDESVIHQQGIAMPPGHYIVRLSAADMHSSRGFRMTDTLSVPDYTLGPAISSPVLVYDADGRTTSSSLPGLISNPRHTVPYGGDPPVIYLESYNAGSAPLQVRVVDSDGRSLWSAAATLREGEDELRYGTVRIPAETLPLGQFWVDVVAAGAQPTRTPLLLTISDQWMVGNIGDVLDFLRYIAHPEELDSLTTGTPADQRAAWDRFWERRDPLPVTDVNEYRDQFFQRVRYATEAFREVGGRAGWDTHRGEVYIVLGPPDHAVERYVGDADMRSEPNAEEWVYTAVPGGRLSLLFYDRTGFGRYELIPSSAAAFRSLAERLKPRPQRN